MSLHIDDDIYIYIIFGGTAGTWLCLAVLCQLEGAWAVLEDFKALLAPLRLFE